MAGGERIGEMVLPAVRGLRADCGGNRHHLVRGEAQHAPAARSAVVGLLDAQQGPYRPAAVTAVKTPLGPLETRLTVCQAGAEIGAAHAACAQPATATTAAANNAARRTLILICFQPSKKPLGQLISTRKTAEARI